VPALFNGDRSAIKVNIHTDPTSGQLQLFADQTKALAAFQGPIGFTVGPRNNLRGPRFSNLDLSLSKSFPIHERLAILFRAQAYNAFNHSNFALPGGGGGGSGADITSSNFGVITSTANDAREMQFALKIEF